MDNPTIWAVIWLALMAGLGIGELMMAGSFFLLPFAVGALVAGVVSLVGGPLPLSFTAFVAVSGASFLAMRPLARRLDADTPDVAGVGANRLLGTTGSVVEIIPAGDHDAGMVKVGGEEWKANTLDGLALDVGRRVRVLDVRGTRLVVEAADEFDVHPPELR